MEPQAYKNILLVFHLFLYLPATVSLGWVLLNQVQGKSVCDRFPVDRRINLAYFLATVAMLVLSALLLAYGVLLVAELEFLLPHIFTQIVKFGSLLYWFLLACFIAQWGRCFG